MFSFIKKLFGAAKDTAEAVTTPEVAREVVSQPEEKKPAAKKRASRSRKTSK